MKIKIKFFKNVFLYFIFKKVKLSPIIIIIIIIIIITILLLLLLILLDRQIV